MVVTELSRATHAPGAGAGTAGGASSGDAPAGRDGRLDGQLREHPAEPARDVPGVPAEQVHDGRDQDQPDQQRVRQDLTRPTPVTPSVIARRGLTAATCSSRMRLARNTSQSIESPTQAATGQPGSRRTTPDVAARASGSRAADLPRWQAGRGLGDERGAAARRRVLAVLVARERAAGRPRSAR